MQLNLDVAVKIIVVDSVMKGQNFLLRCLKNSKVQHIIDIFVNQFFFSSTFIWSSCLCSKLTHADNLEYTASIFVLVIPCFFILRIFLSFYDYCHWCYSHCYFALKSLSSQLAGLLRHSINTSGLSNLTAMSTLNRLYHHPIEVWHVSIPAVIWSRSTLDFNRHKDVQAWEKEKSVTYFHRGD